MNNTPINASAEDAIYNLDFTYSLGCPEYRAGFRCRPEDFMVEEQLGYDPSGEGEHLYLLIRKRNQNTRWIAHCLAEHYGVAEHSVGYSGLKDRRAVTTQWFSVHLPQAELPALPSLPESEVLRSARHSKKLRPGSHRANQFAIVLRFDGGAKEAVESRLEHIAARGVPNYFGEQRFGIGGNNLREVAKILATKRPRFKGRRGGLYLSAARSWLFNLVMDQRVATQRWQSVADGPLWGRGRTAADEVLAKEEAEILKPWSAWCHGLEHSGLGQERRPLVLNPGDFRWHWAGEDLTLEFSLPPGCYATAVLRELAVLEVREQELDSSSVKPE